MQVFLGLGSNMGDRWQHLRDAVSSLRGLGLVGVSPVYETDAVGGPSGQDSYLNLVVELDNDLTARELLGVCHRLETAAERAREVRWGPRTLDVDILWMESGSVNEPDLIVPHPRMLERRFVMAPLADLAPAVVPPDWDDHSLGRVERVGDLYAE